MSRFRTPGAFGGCVLRPEQVFSSGFATGFAAGALAGGAELGVGVGSAAATPGPVGAAAPVSTKTESGKYWVAWANTHATRSTDLDDLADPFRSSVKAFVKALEDAGATVSVETTTRSTKRAYLFHWSWLIYLGKAKPSAAPAMAGVEIEWDHGNLKDSKAGAGEMVTGFGLAVPPKSTLAPALSSNHIAGKAIDMTITWTGTLKVKKKDGTEAEVPFMRDANKNTKLHEVGASYSVKKNVKDAPHWSVNGR